MTYKTGVWGKQAVERNIRRRTYFRERQRVLKNVKNTMAFDSEIEALRLLGEKQKALRGVGFDISWQNKKVDVKSAKLKNNHGSWGWLFLIEKQKGKIDYFLCIAKDKNLKTKYIFLIPDKEIKSKKSLWIGLKKITKYYKFIFKN